MFVRTLSRKALLTFHRRRPGFRTRINLQTTQKAWMIFKDSGMMVLRALGLNVMVSLFKHLQRLLVGIGHTELTKIAIRRSRRIALLHALIHVIPVGVAVWEIVLNWNTYYVGPTIYSLAYYQLGAKAHEMTIQGSLAAILFCYVRCELALGDGLPFGSLFSGLQVSQISYLWSMEFWGSVCSEKLSPYRKARLLTVVVLCVALSAITGPLSAILLIPRLDYWPAGRTDIRVNGTSESLWPNRSV